MQEKLPEQLPVFRMPRVESVPSAFHTTLITPTVLCRLQSSRCDFCPKQIVLELLLVAQACPLATVFKEPAA